MQGLTERQKQILEFIARRTEEQGYPPTIREIGTEMGIRSTNGVNDHLKALERKGFLKREGLKSRALRPVQSSSELSLATVLDDESEDVAFVAPAFLSGSVPLATMPVPVLGRVAAGKPILADEHVETTVQVDRFFLGSRAREDQVFALRVAGESMIEVGILDGDYIFVRKQPEAHSGDIVVALIDGEATVKRYEPRGDVINFVPENRSMAPIAIRREDFRATQILGIVCGLCRRLG